MPEDFEIFSKNPCGGDSLCVGPVLETLKNFRKNPCTGDFLKAKMRISLKALNKKNVVFVVFKTFNF